MKIKNLPKTIYLQIGEDCDHDDWNKIYPSHEVTWCVDKINNNDIVYRLDKRRLNEPKTKEQIFEEEERDKMDLIKKYLPKTYYAGLSSEERLKKMVEDWQRAIKVNQELEEKLSSLLEPLVGDDFCGDCGNKFKPGESRVYSGNSAVYGEYFPESDTPICKKCAERRYTEHRLKVERDIASKNSH